ncbi:hypothetical protein ACCO45_012823 [Purpureocillium lilacinum]|uniref:Uncharacterized protein n=1 Tax=Purpureocillium lilacinum TaxID=33203 RepID=A0ACC4DC65_PURLI
MAVKDPLAGAHPTQMLDCGEQRRQVCDAGSQHSTELELQQAPYYQDESGEWEIPRTGLFWEAVALSKENPRRVNDLGSGKLVAAPLVRRMTQPMVTGIESRAPRSGSVSARGVMETVGRGASFGCGMYPLFPWLVRGACKCAAACPPMTCPVSCSRGESAGDAWERGFGFVRCPARVLEGGTESSVICLCCMLVLLLSSIWVGAFATFQSIRTVAASVFAPLRYDKTIANPHCKQAALF